MSKDIIKPGVVLLIVTVIAAGLLGAVNIATKDTIAQVEADAENKSKREVLPDASEFGEEISNDNKNYGDIKSYSEGKDAEGKVVGYAFNVSTKGFSTGLKLMIGIDTNGVISGVDVLSHNETPGLGANAGEKWKDLPKWVSQFAGKSGEISVTKSDSAGDNEVIAITGATITSNGITKAVNSTIDFYNNVIANKEAAEGGDKE